MNIPPQAEEVQEVPIWVVSFGDMITNLLACFVLMQSLASTQDKTLFNAGMGSFRRAVATYGMPTWKTTHGRMEPRRNYRKIKYPTEESPEPLMQPVINPRDDQLRQLYDDMRKLLNVSASDSRRRVIAVRPMSAKFAPSSASIGGDLQGQLASLAADLTQTLGPRSIIFIMSAAPEVENGPKQWVVSAMRAAAAKETLAGLLSSEIRAGWELGAAGVGAGGRWYANLGLADSKPHVLVVVLEDQ
ncbi:MAG: hypothetical protein GXY38_06995 [Planctomycetes bacterium]|jgi:flagellar motor protein MotB|nr:hypothetical protein [Planctomycetota bacterium]